jgi:hypothetical protein
MENTEVHPTSDGLTVEELEAHCRIELLPDRIEMKRRRKRRRCVRRPNDPCPFIFRPRR